MEAMAKRTLDDSFGGGDKEAEAKRRRNKGADDADAAAMKPAGAGAKPKCKYGSKCYRKNAKHLADYDHGVAADSEHEQSSSASTERSGVDAERESPAAPAPAAKTECVRPPSLAMPADFGHVLADLQSYGWDGRPTAALPMQLTGAFDITLGRLPPAEGPDEKARMAHGRYRCDPVEAQTLALCDRLHVHLAYWRDEPHEVIGVVAIPHCGAGANRHFPKITYVGDNLYAAFMWLLHTLESEGHRCSAVTELCAHLEERAKARGYLLGQNTERKRLRGQKVVAPTLHSFGICVPFKDDIGYRPLSETNASLRKLLAAVGDSPAGSAQRGAKLSKLQEAVTYVQFANDECDFGMGLELGHDLIASGYEVFGSYAKQLLSVAYMLLKRTGFQSVLDAHLQFVFKDHVGSAGDRPFDANCIEIG